MSLSKEIRLVLLGKTGNGKSSLGNNLIGKKIFHAQTCGSSLTATCMVDKRQLEDGKNLVVVDTPGLFDTRKSNQETSLEISRCIGCSSPGPHAFLLVIRIGRFTAEESDTIKFLCDMFGENVMKYVGVVFTDKDSLDYDGKSLEDFVATAPQSLRDVLEACGSRYVAVNNRSTDTSEGLSTVMGMVRRTMTRNGGAHYTGQMYREAEKVLKEKMARMEAEKTREREELERLRKTEELNQRQLKDLDEQIRRLRDFDYRHAVRKDCEEEPSLSTKILKVIGSVAVPLLEGAASRCSLM